MDSIRKRLLVLLLLTTMLFSVVSVVVHFLTAAPDLQPDLASLMPKITKGTVAVLLLSAAMWRLITWSLAPLINVEQAIALRQPDDATPLPTGELPCEVRPLVESFNRLLERFDQARQAERRFISDATHELRTPLAAISAHAQLALRATAPEDTRAALLRLTAVIDRSARLAEQLLDLANLEASARANARDPLALDELVALVVRDFEAIASLKGQSLRLEAEPCQVVGDVDELGILMRNLIDNALRYGGAGVHIVIRCGPLDTAEAVQSQSGALLEVVDDGPGVAAPERARIFDRFYRVAGNGERGSGIGLALVSRIADIHGATIEAGPGLDGAGLRVAVTFPTSPRPAPCATPSVTAAMNGQPAWRYQADR
jgi:signal transduction histidine kinase